MFCSLLSSLRLANMRSINSNCFIAVEARGSILMTFLRWNHCSISLKWWEMEGLRHPPRLSENFYSQIVPKTQRWLSKRQGLPIVFKPKSKWKSLLFQGPSPTCLTSVKSTADPQSYSAWTTDTASVHIAPYSVFIKATTSENPKKFNS